MGRRADKNEEQAPEEARETEISFDLAKVLKAKELESFRVQAAAAGHSLEEHFLAITIGVDPATTPEAAGAA